MGWLDLLKLTANSPAKDKGLALDSLNLPAALDSFLQDYLFAKYDPWYQLINTNGYRDAFGNLHGQNLEADMGLFSLGPNTQNRFGVNGVKNGDPQIQLKPNPFVNGVKIEMNVENFGLRGTAIVQIFNINGKQIFQSAISANHPEITWRGTDGFGNPVSPGVYVIRIKNGNTLLGTKRLVMVR